MQPIFSGTALGSELFEVHNNPSMY